MSLIEQTKKRVEWIKKEELYFGDYEKFWYNPDVTLEELRQDLWEELKEKYHNGYTYQQLSAIFINVAKLRGLDL